MLQNKLDKHMEIDYEQTIKERDNCHDRIRTYQQRPYRVMHQLWQAGKYGQLYEGYKVMQ